MHTGTQFPAPVGWSETDFQAHILPNGVHASGIGRGDLGQKQMGDSLGDW